MGIFRQFPYSNFHEMNMDEIIKIVKHMLEEWAQYYAEWDAWMAEINDDWSNYQEVMNEAWESMRDFINTYFDTLDVQEEINNKIISMVNTGEFASIMSPYIPPQVTAWLAANVTQPEGVVIDQSLSIAGACADAKASGDAIDQLREDVYGITNTSLIEFTPNYVINTSVGIGNTVSLTPIENSSFSYAIVDCVENDQITLNGRGWTTGRLWAFLDSDNVILTASAASISADNLVITAPENAAKCIINSWKTYLGACYIGKPTYLVERQLDANITDIEKQLCATYNNYEQGTINSSGTPVTNNDIMRSVDFIPLDNILSISVNSSAYLYFHIYDNYGVFLGHIVTLGYGDDYPNETVNYNTIKTLYPAAGSIKITIHGRDPITPSNIDDTEIKFIYFYNLKVKTAIVDINGTGDFTSILEALKTTPPTTKIYVKNGTYNVVNEYTDYYGASFWADYAGYGGQDDDFLRGLYISNGRTIEFEPGAVILFNYNGENTYVANYFSVLATGYDATIIGGYIDYGLGLAEYAIHDDNATQAGTNTFKGIIIDGVPSGRGGNHIGGGCGKKNTYILEDIIFLDDNMPDNYGDMYYHNNNAAGAINRIFVKNCRGLRGCSFRWHGSSTELTYCIVCGNSFKRIRCIQHQESDTNENMVMIAYNNITTE